MKTVLGYYKKYIPFVCIILLVLFGQVMCELLLPTYMSDIIDNGIVAGDMDHIKHVGLIMIGVAFAAVVFSVTGSLFASMTAAKSARNIRKALFTKVTSFSRAEIERFSAASLITRSTNDVQMIQQATVMCLRMMIFAPIMGIGAVFMALKTSVSLSWTVGLALICVCGLMVFSFVAIFPRFKKMQEKLDRVNLIMKERLSGTLVVRAFRTEAFEQERFDKANVDLTKLYIFVNKCLSFLLPSILPNSRKSRHPTKSGGRCLMSCTERISRAKRRGRAESRRAGPEPGSALFLRFEPRIRRATCRGARCPSPCSRADCPDGTRPHRRSSRGTECPPS